MSDIKEDSDYSLKDAWAVVEECWFRLLYEKSEASTKTVLHQISGLKRRQGSFAQDYLARLNAIEAAFTCFELNGLYQLAKAAEIYAENVERKDQVLALLTEPYLDQALEYSKYTQKFKFKLFVRLLKQSVCEKYGVKK